MDKQKEEITQKTELIAQLERDLKHANMILEDRLAYILRAAESTDKLYWEMFDFKAKLKEKEA
eukprot:CAMPEP_0170487658 /NCGR_PEP_ID=MMETSP0208-20121228/6424_1 /TAXON_ID=197538 /ORGANISM="Strombidium inclinatum, Strain S3" /LENGTH=62 /DNA_ID=CAMNT_0010762013 /DNA_START=460 /DNA_END=648 /DNA_ORIENTATION=-